MPSVRGENERFLAWLLLLILLLKLIALFTNYLSPALFAIGAQRSNLGRAAFGASRSNAGLIFWSLVTMAPPVGVEMSAGNAVGRGELCRILLIDCARLRGKVLYSNPPRKYATARGLAEVTRSY